MRILFVLLLLLVGCGTQKPQYQTREGRIKQKYYNSIQYGDKAKTERLQKKYNRATKK